MRDGKSSVLKLYLFFVSVTTRAYQPKDRADIRRLFQETAFHGRSFRSFFDDGEWLADIMTAVYTDGEPASVFVAEERKRRGGIFDGNARFEPLVRFVAAVGAQTRRRRIF